MTMTARAIPGVTRPAGIGLPGLWPASRGVSTRSLSVPIETCRAVIETARRRAIAASAPAIVATAATTAPSRTEGNGEGSRTRPPSRAGNPGGRIGRSDVDDLAEVHGEVLDQAR